MAHHRAYELFSIKDKTNPNKLIYNLKTEGYRPKGCSPIIKDVVRLSKSVKII